MSRIDYGRTKEQILETVKSIIVKDGRLTWENLDESGGDYLENVTQNSLLGKHSISNWLEPDAVLLKPLVLGLLSLSNF